MDGTPLYREISNSILHEIETGTYSENVAIPAERALCRMYHASRSTVRRALEVL